LALLAVACARASAPAPEPAFQPRADFRLEPGRGVVVTGSAPAQRCSRQGPPESTDRWTPSAEDIAELERRLVKIEDGVRSGVLLPGRSGPRRPTNFRVSDYYRFYYGLVVEGRRLIYIDALDLVSIDVLREAGLDLSKGPSMVCDGGWGAWGVVYDVKRRQFFDFAVNGEA
jgi:hypothetical protein